MKWERLLMWLCVCVCFVSHAQQPAPIERQLPGAPTITVESRLVPVAVNVTDEHGAPVGGLTAADFEVQEDGNPEPIKVFDAQAASPLDIVLAIDASESTFDDQKLERMAAERFAKSVLRPQDRMDLLEFSDTVTELVPFTNDAKAIDAGLGRIQHGAATALYDAVYLAATTLQAEPKGGDRRRVIVLITDGENTTHRGSYDNSMEQVVRANAMIYALVVVPVEADAGRDTGGEHALIQMTRDTGGKFFYVAEKRDLQPAFAHVSDDLRTQYTLGYYAPEDAPAAPGFGSSVRHIEVRLRDATLASRYTLRYRTGYYRPRTPRTR